MQWRLRVRFWDMGWMWMNWWFRVVRRFWDIGWVYDLDLNIWSIFGSINVCLSCIDSYMSFCYVEHHFFHKPIL